MYNYGKKIIQSMTFKLFRSSSSSSTTTTTKKNDSKRPATSDTSIVNDIHEHEHHHNQQQQHNNNNNNNNIDDKEHYSNNQTTKTTNNRKRNYNNIDGYKTPMLVLNNNEYDHDNPKLKSSLSSSSKSSSYCRTSSSQYHRSKRKKLAGIMGQSKSLLLEMIPNDVIGTNVLSFLTTGDDYYSLQLVCKEMKDLCNKEDILKYIDLMGDRDTGRGSILNDVDSSEVGLQRLYKFAKAGNLQALYMIGMITAYCHGDKIGVTILKQTSRKGCVRSAYAVGLILRDCNKAESELYLNLAISKDYLPAYQELQSSQAVKSKFGDLGHETLRTFFDPIGLNRLIGRCYIQSNGVRGVASSHCWNPGCGRWALKATVSNDRRSTLLQCPSKCLPALPARFETLLIALLDNINELDEDIDSEENRVNNDEDPNTKRRSFRVSRMKMCSQCRRAKYCSKLCQVYDWRSGRHKMECQYL